MGTHNQDIKEQTHSRPVRRRAFPGVWLLRLATLMGFGAAAFYLSWWMVDERWRSPFLLLVLVSAVLYGGMQMAGNWLLYLFAYRSRARRFPPTTEDLTVDVYVTACGEPYEMIERAVAAAVALRRPHATYLLDDGSDPALERMARRLGATYLSRPDRKDAKAGNLNAALPRTSGDIIAIFDIDHVPHPDYLERSLAPFADPEIGFVQVMLTFENGSDSWVAQAAIETSLEFYNPTSLGADGLGGATLMGSNALIRRSALESIGGYQPGLAEDLATSVTLHAAGWKSVYVPEPLAPGLAPPSFVAWFTQQLKWSRGVFELLITTYPRLFFRLSAGQKLSYAVRMTKYWIGPVVAVHLFATIAILMYAGPDTRQAFNLYLMHITPLAGMDVVIRHVAFRMYRHQQVRNASLARAVSLVYATWPIYTLAWIMALVRLPLSFRPTPKDSQGRLNPLWLLPQFSALVLIMIGTVYTVAVRQHPLSLLLSFAAVQGLVQFIFLTQWLYTQPVFQPENRVEPGSGPVAVLDLDIHNLPEQVEGLETSSQAFCLVRQGTRPAGQTLIALPGGTELRGADIRQHVLSNMGWPFWHTWLERQVGWEDAPVASPNLSVTIAICTRDRPEDLERCLAAIDRLSDGCHQVLVVDSASSSESVRDVAAAHPRVRYVRENLPGLNRARSRALLECSTDILAFIDDDAVPDAHWVENLVRNFHDPRVLCVTGLTLPLELETQAQQWFEWYSAFGRGFRRRVYDKNNLHPLSAGHAGAGVNMAFRREVLHLVGLFDEALDAGTPTHSGGDTEMFARILSAGYCIVYDPAALSWHRHRRDWPSLRRAIYGYGVGTYAFWTRRLLVEGEFGVVPVALDWLLRYQLPDLARSLLSLPGRKPLDLLAVELLGCMAGPWAYISSRRQLEARAHDGFPPYQSNAASQPHYSHP
jgi:cellulose synthase/poly-beta-1,6-N-acetylglucosamine synthase-like glycosyltransferase